MSPPSPLLQFVHDFRPGTVIRDFVVPGTAIRTMVTRGAFSFCAYLGVQPGSVIAGLEELDIQCPWGITFQQWGEEGTLWEQGWYWWGWDYGHAFDVIDPLGGTDAEVHAPEMVELLRNFYASSSDFPRRDWTVDEVVQDAIVAAVKLHGQLSHSQVLAGQALAQCAAGEPEKIAAR